MHNSELRNNGNADGKVATLAKLISLCHFTYTADPLHHKHSELQSFSTSQIKFCPVLHLPHFITTFSTLWRTIKTVCYWCLWSEPHKTFKSGIKSECVGPLSTMEYTYKMVETKKMTESNYKKNAALRRYCARRTVAIIYHSGTKITNKKCWGKILVRN